ncbi:MAG TPA: hypothetical protein ENN41_05555 [Sediminispirochaeta sp.]|nr:hypothetical protein [Sediminispirochaeta sp.]
MRKILAILFILLLIPVFLSAQDTAPRAVLAYYEDETQIEVLDSQNQNLPVSYGMSLQEGDTIRTGNTVAELQLEPNGSIVKLSRNTVFSIDQFQTSEESSNDFTMAAGKLRAIASRSGIGNRYRVSTPSAVCGVRGTDFGIVAVPGSSEQAFVNEGVVEFTKTATNESLTLTGGMAADALAATFEAIRLTQEQLQDLLEDLQFEELDPASVPGQEVAEEEQEEESEEEPAEEEVVAATDTDTSTRATGQDSEGGALDAGSEEERESALLNALGQIVGFEIGTITIDGDTWSKAVVMPNFEIGKLKMGLYLPFVYKDDMFDRSQWYRPEGNDEWSFGMDQDWSGDPLGAAQDLLVDLSLKIQYLQWGEQRDPFYLKLGNLHNMTIGHGTIMKNFANDLDFPAVRRVGVNLGVDKERSGFEAVVNDLARPQIFGGRYYFRPIGNFALGFTGITDIDPLSQADSENEAIAALDSMRFFSVGADMELPIFENDVISIIPFADVAAMVPQRDGAFEWDVLYDSDGESFIDSIRNYGFTTGLFGNLLFVDYNLEFRYYDGMFRPNFFGTNYERIRGTIVQETQTYLEDLENNVTGDYDTTVMGIFGGAHTVLFNLVDISAGYMWPWRSLDELNNPAAYNDEFTLSMYLQPEMADIIKVYGGIEYSRTNFLPALTGDELSLFDAYTTVKGEIVYPIAPTLDIAAVVSTAVQTEDGRMVYDQYGNPKIVPNITIETRIHF